MQDGAQSKIRGTKRVIGTQGRAEKVDEKREKEREKETEEGRAETGK